MKRKYYSARTKAVLLQEYFNGTDVSVICSREQIQPTVFLAWKNQFLKSALKEFVKDPESMIVHLKSDIVKLQDDLKEKDRLINQLLGRIQVIVQ